MRAGLVMSGVLHLALLAAVAIPYQRQTAHGETMSVELIPEKDTGDAFKEQAAPAQQQAALTKDETQPDWSKLQINSSNRDAPASGAQQQKSASGQQSAPSRQPSSQQEPPQQKPQQKPQATQQPAAATPSQPLSAPLQPFPQNMPAQSEIAPELTVDTIQEQGKRIAALMNLPPPNNDGFGTEADAAAKLEVVDIAQFKAHLKSCWTLPAGISATQQLKLIVRVALRQNGTLATDPTLIEAPASALGPPLFGAAMKALKSCAPYTMLPAAKYNEWKVLDLNFSPDQMAGG